MRGANDYRPPPSVRLCLKMRTKLKVLMDRWFRLWIEKSEVIEKLCAKMTELFENIRM